MKRRVDQANRNGLARHRFEDPFKIALLDDEELCKSVRPNLLVLREDHLLDDGQAVRLEEHVLGSTEPDALGAKFDGLARVARVVGVRANFELPSLIGP